MDDVNVIFRAPLLVLCDARRAHPWPAPHPPSNKAFTRPRIRPLGGRVEYSEWYGGAACVAGGKEKSSGRVIRGFRRGLDRRQAE